MSKQLSPMECAGQGKFWLNQNPLMNELDMIWYMSLEDVCMSLESLSLRTPVLVISTWSLQMGLERPLRLLTVRFRGMFLAKLGTSHYSFAMKVHN